MCSHEAKMQTCACGLTVQIFVGRPEKSAPEGEPTGSRKQKVRPCLLTIIVFVMYIPHFPYLSF